MDKKKKLVAQGAKYDIVKNLAYNDVLTGLGNRTSYLEKIKEMTDNSSKAGIVFLDLNNLKKINDSYGHKVGDEYIISASKIIKNSFGRYGNSYRIGSDEFCVFIEGLDISSKFRRPTSSCTQIKHCSRKAFHRTDSH